MRAGMGTFIFCSAEYADRAADVGPAAVATVNVVSAGGGVTGGSVVKSMVEEEGRGAVQSLVVVGLILGLDLFFVSSDRSSAETSFQNL